MKKRLLAVVGCLAAVCLTACQGKSAADANWAAAKKTVSLEEYLKQEGSKIDVEALKKEADSEESSLSQQFKAAALLGGLEYWNHIEEENLAENTGEAKDKNRGFQYGYPVSGPYASRFLENVNAGGDGFWPAFDEAFYPYDCFMPLLAAADGIDGQTVLKLLEGIPGDSRYGDKLEAAIDRWMEYHPVKMALTGGEFMDAAYFEDWDMDDWSSVYFYNISNPGSVQTDTAKEALTYISYLRGTMLPELEAEFGKDKIYKESQIEGQGYYDTKLAVTIGEALELQEPVQEGLPEVIETEGKTLAAFYRNPDTEEFKDASAPLRMMGDFMLTLADEEYPESVSDADYYLVLTPHYEYGDFYQLQTGKETKVRQVNSSTSIDLYEAKTGTFLRHLGNVMEKPAETVFKNSDVEALEYPKLVSADVLYYIYHNINEPEKYISLTDQITGLPSDLQAGEPVTLGGWEITYHSGKATKTFDDGIYRFTAKDGCQFVRAEFTVTNRRMKEATFLPMFYYPAEDPIVQVADATRETFYDSTDAPQIKRCLNEIFLAPGESREGELFFEVPEEVLQGEEPVYIAVSLGNRHVFYPLGMSR